MATATSSMMWPWEFWVYLTSGSFTQVNTLLVIKYEHMTTLQSVRKYQSLNANNFKRNLKVFKSAYLQSNSSTGKPPPLEWENPKFRFPQSINGAYEPTGKF